MLSIKAKQLTKLLTRTAPICEWFALSYITRYHPYRSLIVLCAFVKTIWCFTKSVL